MQRPSSPGPAYPPPYLSNPSISAQYERKQKRGIMGITAGAEDVKYQAKYRELKKKVKEIESDNDRLYFKLLLAKKNIRRMNLERAILYERLAAVPPTPGRHTQELPSEQDPIFHSQPPAPPEHAHAIDPNDRELSEYMRAHPNAQLIPGPDGRVVAIEDTPSSIDARGAPVPMGPPPPYGIPLVHGFRHDSGPGYDPARQLPPPPPMIPLLQEQESAPEPSVTNEHPANQYTYPHSRPPPLHNSHSHSNSSHHSRSSSARPDLDAVTGGTSRIEASGGPYPAHSRSPNMLGEPQVEHRNRRHDNHEHTHPHGHQPPHPHVQIPQQNLPPSPTLVSPTAHHRGSRIHNHQRIGPGANIHRERDPEREWELQQQLEHDRALEREREAQREVELRHRLALEEQEEEALWAEERARAHAMSRSGSPGSTAHAGGSRDASLPATGQAHEYDRAPRTHTPHVSNLLGIERDPAFKDDERNTARDRMPTAEVGQGSSLDRFRDSRDEMEVDDRYDAEARPANEGAAASRGLVNLSGNRGGKRSHSEEDGDAGHPMPGKGDGLPDESMEDA